MSTQLWRIPEVAERLRCGTSHVYDLIAGGHIKAVDIATPGARRSKTRVRDDDLAVYIDAATRTASRLRAAR